MNIETLIIILLVAVVAAFIARLLSGWTVAGLLASYLLACFGAVGGWFAQQRLELPPLYSIAFPGDNVPVAIVWPTLAGIMLAMLGAFVNRRPRPRPRSRRRVR